MATKKSNKSLWVMLALIAVIIAVLTLGFLDKNQTVAQIEGADDDDF